MRRSLQWRHNGHDGVSNHQPHDCLHNRLFRSRSKKTSKIRDTGLCAGNSPGTGEFPAQMASNAEHVSIWWRHHVVADVIVGAPYEDDGSGAVYIYNGAHYGINMEYSQRLTPHDLGLSMRGFGGALSSDLDIDDNGYPGWFSHILEYSMFHNICTRVLLWLWYQLQMAYVIYITIFFSKFLKCPLIWSTSVSQSEAMFEHYQYLTLFFWLLSLSLGQSYDCLSVSEVTL